MFITNAYAQAAPGGFPGGDLMTFLPMIAIFVVFYFLLIRPQQKRAKEQAKLIITVVTGGYQSVSWGQFDAPNPILDGVWWAATTVTTVGYGDLVPTSTTGRLIAALVMIRPVWARPKITLPRLSPVRSHSSRMRESRNTS